jgi:predicted RNA-binding Zn-ribbon protein involved in translation (DUF1610 family)
MTKKNFRKLASAPEIIVKCVGCGLKVEKSETEDRFWITINEDKNLFCCPNCDITIIHKEQ